MFDIGLPEIMVLLVVAVLVFGPDKLPDFARQLARFLHGARRMVSNARTELRDELGPEWADLDISDLDPRSIVRKHVFEPLEEDDDDLPASRRPLSPGERPPYDPDAT